MTKKRIYRSARFGGVLLFLCIWLLPSISVGQNLSDYALRKMIYRKPVDFAAPGVRIGSFVLNPGVELAWEHNDNIFYFSRDLEQAGLEQIGDNIIHVRPWLDLKSDWNRHALNLYAFVDAARYKDYDSENYTDWVVRLNGRVDVKRGSAFNYRAEYLHLHQNRGSPDDRNGIEPTIRKSARYAAGYAHSFNRLTPALRYQYEDLNYDNNENILGEVIDNSDRNRSRDTLSLRLNYAYSEQSSIFLQYAANKVKYDQKTDRNGYQRSSDGYNIRAGMEWDMPGLLTGNLFAQYLSQDYDDLRFNKVDGFGIGAELVWTPTQLTDIRFRFENRPRETTQAGSSGYFSQIYSVRIQHELRRNILLNGRFSYTDNSYQTNDDAVSNLQGTKTTRAGFGLSYLFNRNFYLSGGYVYTKQNASDSFYDYTTNRWYIALGMEL